jgi:hypothetical protein
MATRTRKQRGKAADSCGLDEEDPSPSLVTSSALAIGSDPVEEVVKEEATPESGQTAATRTNQRGEATLSSCSSVEEDGGAGREEQDSKPSAVTSNARIGSSPGQEVVQEQATKVGKIPYGWKRVKLEPDC